MLKTCRNAWNRRICRPEPSRMDSYSAVVDAYIRDWRDGAQRERQFFKGCSLQRVIEFAALCKLPGGKRHPHQYRLPRAVLAEAGSNLQEAAAEIRGCQTFADLHDLVRREIGGIAGIGRLTVYDVATRIGAHLDLAPERVYLHAGTAAAAKALGIKAGETVSRAALPDAFRRLRAYEIEDCLCLYKRQLARIARTGGANRLIPVYRERIDDTLLRSQR
jgi:hypothetical protein